MSLIVDPFDDRYFVRFLRGRVKPTELMIPEFEFSSLLSMIFDRIGRARLYQLTPIECRKSGAPTPNPELGRHGTNLPAVVRFMQRNHAKAWGQTLSALRRVVPGLEAIETDFTPERTLSLKFVESGTGRPWSPAEVSDGTIHSLALFTALFDPRSPFLIIEEPENSVHPWIIRVFVDACREVNSKQTLLTTHSPALISYLRPQEVAVVWRDDARSCLVPLTELDPEASKLWESGELNLFDIVDAGWLKETLPAGYA